MKIPNIYGVVAATAVLCSVSGVAAELPAPMKNDSRLREIIYDPHQVITINIIKGVGTHIALAKNESIKIAAPGFGADCEKPDLDWCIVANVGDSDVFVKAKSGAVAPNNLELTTDKRVYSFDFVLNKDFKRDKDAMFRVMFKYPDDEAAEAAKAKKTVDTKEIVAEKLQQKNKPQNFNYKMQPLGGADIITPSSVYDDGMSTYLKFPANRQMPEAFVVEADGTETIPPSHREGADTIVLHRVYKHLNLRLSKAVVGIWNESYDIDGVAPKDGVTVEGLKRVVRSVP